MKPFRGKRVEPQSLAGEFSPSGARRPRSTGTFGTAQRSAASRRAHFPRRERHDRLSGRRNPAGKVASPSGPVLQSRAALVGRTTEALRRSRPRARPSGRRRRFDWGGLALSAPRPPAAQVRQRPSRSSGSVASRSALHPTRLETRTKESNMCASHWVLRNPRAQ